MHHILQFIIREQINLRNFDVRIRADLLQDPGPQGIQTPDRRLIKKVSVVLPAAEDLSAAFLNDKGDLKLGLSHVEVNRLDNHVTNGKLMTSLADQEHGYPLLINTGNPLHGKRHLEKG